MLPQTFRAVAAGARALDEVGELGPEDAALARRLAALFPRLPNGGEPRTDKEGGLAEWWDEREGPDGAARAPADEGHRHFSHLYPLHPGDGIDPIASPALAAAARRSLVRRLRAGGGHTGWSAAWAASLWARLHDGAMAHAALRYTLHEFAAPNLLGLHPKLRGTRQGCVTCVGRGAGGAGEGMYQLDANGGYTAAVAEMLVQSHSQVCQVHLLPALPPAWPEGDAHGLRARGAWRVDVRWAGGKLASAAIARAPADEEGGGGGAGAGGGGGGGGSGGGGDDGRRRRRNADDGRRVGVATTVRVCCAPKVCGTDGGTLAAAARVDFPGKLVQHGAANHLVWAWNATVTDEKEWAMQLPPPVVVAA